ncbi:hypothetical protein DFQ27_005619 [Actinomortierella ambigua]|uniref:C2H2-type domain-containing protein n=1 Tax=Actinomortierella ambigua TaxID=1343610 RepID=A0A9P6QIG5_9FUNG|nr:hypothetical protein DFQ27_005619 [Actinomortierella ambigua]
MAQGFAPTMVTTQMPATAVMVKEEQLRYQITPTDVLFGQYLFPFVTPLPNFVVDSGESRMSREPSIAKADCDDARGPLDQTSVATEQPEIGEGGCNTDDDESTVFEDCDNNDEGDSDSDSDSDFFPSSAKRRISTGSTSSLPLAVHRKKVQKANHLSSDVPAPRKGTTKDNRRTSIVKLKTATPLQRDTATTTTTTATTTTTTTTMTTIQEDPVYRCRFPGCDQICSAEESWSLHEGTHDKAEMYPFQCGSYVDLDPLRSHLYRDHPIYDKEGNLVSNAYDRAEVAASLRRQFHCAICRSSSRSSSSSSSSSRNNSRSNSRNSRSRSQSSSSTNSVAFLEGNDRGEDEEQEDAAVVAHATNNFKRRLAGIYVSGYRLRRHILDVHGPHRRFSCPDKCQLAFSTQDALDRHLANPGDWHDEKE